MPVPDKRCRRCGLTKPWSDFVARKSNVCKRCKKAEPKKAVRENKHTKTLTPDDAALIRQLYSEYKVAKQQYDEIENSIGPRALGRKFGVTYDLIYKIARGDIWKEDQTKTGI